MTTQQSSVTPEPGVYPKIDMAEYHAWSAASNSRLNHLRRSPAHLRAYLEAEHVETEALRVGSATHTAILEPDLFGSRYVSSDQCEASKKNGERCTNPGVRLHSHLGWLCGVHAKGETAFDESKIVLSLKDLDACKGARDAVYAHPKARALLGGDGEAELSALWTDPESSVLCKGRFDRWSPVLAGGVIVDIKTTIDASPREFERTIFSRKYYAQGAMYLAGARALGIQVEHYVIIAVEKTPPFGCLVYRLTEGALDAGASEIKPLLRLYGELQAQPRNEWPGYPQDVVDVALPPWAWNVVDETAKELEEAQTGEVAA